MTRHIGLKEAIGRLMVWSFGIALLYVAIYLTGWRSILSIFTDSEEIIATARHYIGWVIVIPLAGCLPFLIDGILLGATRTKMLRNTMFIAIACYFALYYATVGTLGNNAIWLAFVSFIVLRGALLLIVTRNLSPARLMPDPPAAPSDRP